ncbi:MAG TPA: hypothetical protein VJ044_00745, partial [Candidatus Hodarchaeales archaeon]|nr:hypothetical protein [Candidatus Hodarchaeales archaeon]
SDLRSRDPRRGYEHYAPEISGRFKINYDLLDLFRQFFLDVKRNLAIMASAAQRIPETPPSTKEDKIISFFTAIEGWSRLECPSGERNYYLSISKEGKIVDFRWQSAILAIWQLLRKRGKHLPIEDFNIAFDLHNTCSACLDG